MKLAELKKEIELPSGIQVKIDGGEVIVKGPKGENSRIFTYPRMKMSVLDNKIILSVRKADKKDKTMLGTFNAHVRNLVRGVEEGFTYKLKICSGHFPMSVKAENNTVVISNFMGEKLSRKAKILPEVQVTIQGDIITLTGPNKEMVGQSAANIELATRRTGFDKRIFQDGCYIIEKAGRGI